MSRVTKTAAAAAGAKAATLGHPRDYPPPFWQHWLAHWLNGYDAAHASDNPAQVAHDRAQAAHDAYTAHRAARAPQAATEAHNPASNEEPRP